MKKLINELKNLGFDTVENNKYIDLYLNGEIIATINLNNTNCVDIAESFTFEMLSEELQDKIYKLVLDTIKKF